MPAIVALLVAFAIALPARLYSEQLLGAEGLSKAMSILTIAFSVLAVIGVAVVVIFSFLRPL